MFSGSHARSCGRRPHFLPHPLAHRDESGELCGHRPHNPGIGLIEAQILVQLPRSARTDPDRFQFHGECREKLLAIFGAVRAMELVRGDVPADEPIPRSKAQIDGVAGPTGQLLMHTLNGANEIAEGRGGRSWPYDFDTRSLCTHG